MTKTKSKVERVHFTIEGTWFTWFLRHLWVDGNEAKAIKTWKASFPNCSSTEDIKNLFLKIVSGKAKFTGDSNGDGFQFVDDSTKYWDPDQSGKPNKSFPLMDSWEDVILRKKAQLYVAELTLRFSRLNRSWGFSRREVNNNVLHWAFAAEENKIDNSVMSEVNKLWTDIHNMNTAIGMKSSCFDLPEGFGKLDTKSWLNKNKTLSKGKEKGDTFIEDGILLYKEILGILDPIQEYFTKKYGCEMFFYEDSLIKEICGIEDERTNFYRSEKKGYESPSSVMIAKMVNQIVPGLDVDKYVKNLMAEDERTEIVPENVAATKDKWTSGYIDRKGNFYGCADINHINFSVDLCKMLGEDVEEEKFDAQVHLDKLGWVKVSVNRFFWDEGSYNDRFKLTQAQLDTIYDYVKVHNLKETIFNRWGQNQSYKDAFDNYEVAEE